jgi:methyl-accepting chemotaxis protein
MLKNLSIRAGILWILVLFGTALIGISGYAWLKAQQHESGMHALYNLSANQVNPLNEAYGTLLRSRIALAAGFVELQAGETDNAKVSAERASQYLLDANAKFTQFLQAASRDQQQSHALQLQQSFRAYFATVEKSADALTQGAVDRYMAANLQARAANSVLQDDVLKFMQLAAETNSELMQLSEQRATQTSWMVLIFVVFTLLMLTASWGFIQQRLIRPLQSAGQHFNWMAAGDLSRVIDIEHQNEIGRLLVGLQYLQQSQRDTISQINQTAGQLAAAAEELSVVTEQSSGNLTVQNAELQQAATAVNEMTVAVEDVAQNAVSTSEASQASNQLAQQSRQEMQRTIAETKLMSDEMLQSTELVSQLSTQAKDIGQVLDVIRAVAEQTNLLALNAAIEAARAGAAGRGFAVVADEVRALAHRTQNSTRQIEQLIQQIQQGTQQAVQAMEQSSQRADVTLTLANKAGQALEQIFTSISHINDRNLLIATASEQQAQVAREVDRSLVTIRDLSVQTATGAHQTNVASQELTSMAAMLMGLVQKFRL